MWILKVQIIHLQGLRKWLWLKAEQPRSSMDAMLGMHQQKSHIFIVGHARNKVITPWMLRPQPTSSLSFFNGDARFCNETNKPCLIITWHSNFWPMLFSHHQQKQKQNHVPVPVPVPTRPSSIIRWKMVVMYVYVFLQVMQDSTMFTLLVPKLPLYFFSVLIQLQNRKKDFNRFEFFELSCAWNYVKTNVEQQMGTGELVPLSKTLPILFHK